MKKSVFIFSAVGLMLTATLAKAQEKQSIVVISEAQIASLTDVLRKYKKNKREVNYTSEDILLYNREAMPKSTFELDYLRQQIALLEARLQKNVNKKESEILDNKSVSYRDITPQQPRNTAGTNVVVVPSSKKNVGYLNLDTSSKNDNLAYAELKAKLDSLYVFAKAEKINAKNSEKAVNPNLEGNLAYVKQPNYDNAFAELQNRMDSLHSTMEAKKNGLTKYEILKAKYKGFKREIYFANNATRLDAEAQEIVEVIYDVMDSNDHLDIIVKGFASDVGNSRYNEQLSMQRTEAVKKGLMLRGIHPTRVLTQHHGIDYKATNAESARRVELSFLVRR